MDAEMFCFREDLSIENMELRAEIAGLKNCSDINWRRMKALLIRAADALDYYNLDHLQDDLIAELRKAAE
jgi:hypothetical protein